MSNLVYLFELDSTLRSLREIRRGQEALVEEVVRNGNSVVLSFNQLVDSPGFVSALRDEGSYAAIQGWFAVGAIQVSPYSGASTASEYLQRAAERFLDASSDFRFSALGLLPDNGYDRLLVEAMLRSVRYGDLEQLESMCESAREEGIRRKNEVVLRLVRLVLTLNLEPLSCNRKKGCGGSQFRPVLQRAVDDCLDPSWSEGREFDGARDLLKELLNDDQLVPSQDRSVYLAVLELKGATCEPSVSRVAELVIDLCYNYVVEDSIWGVSKHYRSIDDQSFCVDFRSRLLSYASTAGADGHFYHSERSVSGSGLDVIPVKDSWTTTAWILRAVEASTRARTASLSRRNGTSEGTYEESIEGTRAHWRRSLQKSFAIHFLALLGFLVAFMMLNFGLSYLNALAEELDLLYFPRWLYPIAVVIAFALLASLASKIFRVPDILDTLTAVVGSVRGWREVWRAPNGAAHTLREEHDDSRQGIH